MLNEAANSPYIPQLTTRDWNAEWKELQKARRAADVAAFWDKKAANYGSKDAPSNYVLSFLDMVNLEPGDTIFDMGCGNGGLAIPLAQRGHQVLACDFSQGMLDYLKNDRDQKGLTDLIETKLMSWSDDWEAADVGENCVDVAIASRSIATADLKDSLLRLNKVARKRACITLTTGASPRSDERLLTQLGLQNQIGRDYLYAFNILAQLGLKPSISYIESEKDDTFDSYEEAFEALTRMVNDVTTPLPQEERDAALVRLAEWLKDDLEENPDPTPGAKKLRLSKPRCITWAFISWNTKPLP